MTDVVLHLADPLLEPGAVGVGGKRVDDLHLRLELHLLAEDPERSPLLHDAAAQRVLGLEADDEDDVVRVAQAVLEVVQDAPALAHAARGNDDHRTRHVV